MPPTGIICALSLDESKCLRELSEGMKVKFLLTLALSHHAKLLLLDEPTKRAGPRFPRGAAGNFPAAGGGGVAILFSTHITSDLEKCADDITYIQKGEILATGPIGEFQQSYRLIRRQGG